MCGIAGVYSFDGMSRTALVKAMTDILAHRGPDGDGFHIDGGMVLGHRRLKIIDLSERAKQPIADAARRAIVTFNGEIYNYKELRRELAARGHVFASSGDAETIPLAYLEWGRAFLERLHGMFAFALYESSRRLLILARDRIGIKPLYIAKTPRFVAFASEIKALVGSRLIEPCINRRVRRGSNNASAKRRSCRSPFVGRDRFEFGCRTQGYASARTAAHIQRIFR